MKGRSQKNPHVCGQHVHLCGGGGKWHLKKLVCDAIFMEHFLCCMGQFSAKFQFVSILEQNICENSKITFFNFSKIFQIKFKI